MRKNNPHYLYALDIGSKKLTLACGQMHSGGGVGSVLIETQPSRGIFKGVVNDLGALSDSIQQLFKKMQVRCNHRATEVALSINGNYINARNSIVAMALSERGMRAIMRRDIEKLNQQARLLGLELEERLLHEYPQGYSVDRHNTTLNPLGLHGRRLELNLLLITANASHLENIIKAVEQTGLDVVNIVFSCVAASEAVLDAQEKEKGVVLVDIGDALSSVLFFKDGVIRRVSILSFGGRNIAEVISNYYRIPLELADEIKESSVEIGHQIQETEEVMIKTESDYRPIQKRELASITQPEVDRFIATLKRIVLDSGLPELSGVPMVVTGGLSLLEGLLEKMEQDLNLSVRIGLVKGISDIPPSKAAAYASAIGLLYLYRDSYQRTALQLHSQGKNKITKILDYLIALYRDYF